MKYLEDKRYKNRLTDYQLKSCCRCRHIASGTC